MLATNLAIFAEIQSVRCIGRVFPGIINTLFTFRTHQFNDGALVLSFAGFFNCHMVE